MFLDLRTGKYSDIEPFAECPSCKRLINLKSLTAAFLEGARECPSCQTSISRKEIVASGERYLKTTKAIQSAGEILDSYRSLLVIFGMVLLEMSLIHFGDWGKFNFLFYLTLIMSVLMMFGGFLNVQNWLSNFGNLPFSDEEYLSVRRQVRRAQIVWVWANILNAIWWFVYIRFL